MRALIERDSSELSVRRQCELPGLSRSSLYYEAAAETEANLCLMRLIDEQYLANPFYGSRWMTVWLKHTGHAVNRRPSQRLMRLMGVQAIYPKPRLSQANKVHRESSYLLRSLSIDRVNRVWARDNNVPLSRGFMHLVAVIDWRSRYVLSWRMCNSLESCLCIGRPWRWDVRRSSTRTRECSSRIGSLRADWNKLVCQSAWMVRVRRWTTCLWTTVVEREVRACLSKRWSDSSVITPRVGYLAEVLQSSTSASKSGIRDTMGSIAWKSYGGGARASHVKNRAWGTACGGSSSAPVCSAHVHCATATTRRSRSQANANLSDKTHLPVWTTGSISLC